MCIKHLWVISILYHIGMFCIRTVFIKYIFIKLSQPKTGVYKLSE